MWSSGDVIVSAGAAFVNQGTLLLLEETDEAIGDVATTSSTRNRDGLAPRIRAAGEGEGAGWRGGGSSTLVEAMLSDGRVSATGGAGAAGGGGGTWAWEEFSYDG